MTVIESVPFTMDRKQMQEAHHFYVLAILIAASAGGISSANGLKRIATNFFNLQKPKNWGDVAGVEEKLWRDMWLTSSFNYAHSCYGRYGGVAGILEEEGFTQYTDTEAKQDRLERLMDKCIDGLAISPTFSDPSPICHL